MCCRCNHCMTSTIFRMLLQLLHIRPHSNRCMRIHYITIRIVYLLNDCFCFFITNVSASKISFNAFELFFVNSQFTSSLKIFHPTCCTFTIFTRNIVQKAFKVRGFKNIHRRRNRRIERTIHIVCTIFKEISKYVILIRCTNQFSNRNPHFLSIVSSQDITEVTCWNNYVESFIFMDSTLCYELSIGIYIVHYLRCQTTDVDGVRTGEHNTFFSNFFCSRFINKEALQELLSIVKVTMNSRNINILPFLFLHLFRLHRTNAISWIEYLNMSSRYILEAFKSRFTSITRGSS